MDSCKKFSVKLCYFFATGFGVGIIFKLSIGHGTMASLVAIPIWWGVVYLSSYLVYYIFLVVSIGIGIYFCSQATKITGIYDHRSIVWDEFVGMWITLIVIPTPYDWHIVIMAFFLFRILDIAKPFPICWCDYKIRNGFGIIFDDIVAGSMAACIILFF